MRARASKAHFPEDTPKAAAAPLEMSVSARVDVLKADGHLIGAATYRHVTYVGHATHPLQVPLTGIVQARRQLAVQRRAAP